MVSIRFVIYLDFILKNHHWVSDSKKPYMVNQSIIHFHSHRFSCVFCKLGELRIYSVLHIIVFSLANRIIRDVKRKCGIARTCNIRFRGRLIKKIIKTACTGVIYIHHALWDSCHPQIAKEPAIACQSLRVFL